MPWAAAQGHFFAQTTRKGLGANADYIGLAYNHDRSRTRAVPGDVSFAMAIPADKPLLVKPVGMLGNTGEVNGLIGRRLLSHQFTALFAMFSRHRSSSYILI
jgi:hypothetical protein